MIGWTGLAPWAFEFLFSGSLAFTFQGIRSAALEFAGDYQVKDDVRMWRVASVQCLQERAESSSSSLLHTSLELSDTKVYEP